MGDLGWMLGRQDYPPTGLPEQLVLACDGKDSSLAWQPICRASCTLMTFPSFQLMNWQQLRLNPDPAV